MKHWKKLIMLLLAVGATPTGALASQPCAEFSSTQRATLVLREVSVDDEVVEAGDEYRLESSTYRVVRVPEGLSFQRVTDGNIDEIRFTQASINGGGQ